MTKPDQAFKELLTTFFVEFLDLFVPDVPPYLDTSSVDFLDKEIFTDSGRFEADVVVRARFKGEDSFFLIHTEAQAQHQANFPRRMFDYYCTLHGRYGLPIYPVALLSFDTPTTAQPSEYIVSFPDREVLRFNYAVIQLNRLGWRPYVVQHNPVAAALVPKMKIASKDRGHVKLECELLLDLLKLDWFKQRIISGFIETYLPLTAEEQKQYQEERSMLPRPQQEAIMAFEPRWKQEGLEQGLEQGRRLGMVELVRQQLSKRLGTLDELADQRLQKLSPEQLNVLNQAAPNFARPDDLDEWFSSQTV